MNRKIGGVTPPIVTLYDSNGNIDWAANERHLDFLIEKGVDGVAYLGTTGEFGTLSMAEKKEFLARMHAYANGRVTLLAGASDTCLKNVIELAQYCETIGYDGLLITPPYFSVYTPEMNAAFFGAVAEATGLPVILYNFPALTGFDMTAGWVAELVKRYPGIVGIKETVPDFEHVKAMMEVKKVRSDFMIFTAYDDQFLEARRLGVDGFIHAAANYAPEAAVAMWAAKTDGELEAAYADMMGAMRIYSQGEPLYLAVKEAVYQREGVTDCAERLPALRLAENCREAIGRILAEQGLDRMQ